MSIAFNWKMRFSLATQPETADTACWSCSSVGETILRPRWFAIQPRRFTTDLGAVIRYHNNQWSDQWWHTTILHKYYTLIIIILYYTIIVNDHIGCYGFLLPGSTWGSYHWISRLTIFCVFDNLTVGLKLTTTEPSATLCLPPMTIFLGHRKNPGTNRHQCSFSKSSLKTSICSIGQEMSGVWSLSWITSFGLEGMSSKQLLVLFLIKKTVGLQYEAKNESHEFSSSKTWSFSWFCPTETTACCKLPPGCTTIISSGISRSAANSLIIFGLAAGPQQRLFNIWINMVKHPKKNQF